MIIIDESPEEERILMHLLTSAKKKCRVVPDYCLGMYEPSPIFDKAYDLLIKLLDKKDFYAKLLLEKMKKEE